MDKKQIEERLRDLIKEEQIIRSKLAYKKLVYKKEEWFPSNSKVTLFDHEMVINENDEHCYISYMESNNSFNLVPQKPLFDNLNIYKKLHVSFHGEKKGECEVSLFLISYVQQEKNEVFAIQLDSNVTIDIGNIENIRLALKIKGNGKFNLKSIIIEPTVDTKHMGTTDALSERQVINARELKVAMVVDEFTYESFRHECQAIYLSPENWLQTMQLNKPDLFFCESAWSGKDSDIREWRGKVYSSINFKKENRNELLKILQYCKENGITTIFWNKEDPSHYDDKIHNFVDTALKFDFIFTTAEECVQRYKNEYKHKNVYPLMFAVQPKQFNPIETYERTDEIIFSGSYYRQHPQRCKVMDQLFDLIVREQNELVIYDRQYYNQDENHTFPQQFAPYIRPRLRYTQLDKGYKGSKYAININTETESNTMFARRVFELMASNTLVISNYSRGLDKQFGDLLFLFDLNDKEEDLQVLNRVLEVDYYKHRLKALRYVLKYHTYEDRMAYILDTIGIKVQKQATEVCAVMFIQNEHELIESIELFERQNYFEKKLLIINQGKNSINTAYWLSKYGNNAIFITDINMLEKYKKNLDDFINSEYVTFMNLNHYYGNNYLSDMLLCYKFLNREDIVVKNFKFKPYCFVNEASIFASVFPKKALEFFDFDQMNKNILIQKLFEVGYRVFNCDQFNILFPDEKNMKNAIKANI